jgi:hypothetical protein
MCREEGKQPNYICVHTYHTQSKIMGVRPQQKQEQRESSRQRCQLQQNIIVTQ